MSLAAGKWHDSDDHPRNQRVAADLAGNSSARPSHGRHHGPDQLLPKIPDVNPAATSTASAVVRFIARRLVPGDLLQVSDGRCE